MGSFNTSCMVSQQIIIPGTKVVILPIEQQSGYNPVEITKGNEKHEVYGFANTTCYPTAFWGYSGPIIAGEYDDYGRFLIDQTSENEINLISFFNHLLAKSFETKAGKNQFHEHSLNMSELYNPKKKYSFTSLIKIWDSLFEVVEENRVFVSDYKGNPRNLQFAVIHHAAADYLIDYVSKFKDYEKQSYEQKSYFKNYMKKNNKVISLTAIFNSKKESEEVFAIFLAPLLGLSSYGIGEQEGARISPYYNDTSSVIKMMDKIKKQKIADNLYEDTLIDELFEVFKSQINHRYIHLGLGYFNVKLSPMVYASQDYENETGRTYAKMIKAVTVKVNEEITGEKKSKMKIR